MNGWHFGELIIHQKLSFNLDPSISRLYTVIGGDLDPDHAIFHTTRLPFVPVTTVDGEGRPWGSILAAEDGKPGEEGQGFIAHPRYTVLTVGTKVWVGDPLLENKKAFSFDPSTGMAQEDGKDMLIAGIGIEFTTRRRNKFAGKITKFNVTDDNVDMEILVNESVGNCPKYINVRSLDPHPNTSPRIKHRVLNLSPKERLPDDVISFIKSADTVFIGTVYTARDKDKMMYPSHVGMNQRGGRPGFVRVKPSDGRTVVVPDFSGNRIMTSLGNIEASGLASLTFISWTTGDVLYLTGFARNLVGDEAGKVMAFQKTLTEVDVNGFIYVEDALTVRQTPGTVPERSPYSPPVLLLVEEQESTQMFTDAGEDEVKATLVGINLHSPTVATFTWEASKEIDIKPGQAIILDLKSFLGSVRYQHMSAGKPSSVNDDRIRTWTVSSSNGPSKKKLFDTTMKLKKGGAATTALFAISHKLMEIKPEMCADTRDLGLTVRIMGVTGEFHLPTTGDAQARKMLWVAGGIGVTPFLSMLKGLAEAPSGHWDVVLLLSTREPEVLLPLISAIRVEAKGRVKLTLAVFSKEPFYSADIPLERHKGRLTSKFFSDSPLLSDTKDREVYLCGPAEFEEQVVEELRHIGIPTSSIRRERFVY